MSEKNASNELMPPLYVTGPSVLLRRQHAVPSRAAVTVSRKAFFFQHSMNADQIWPSPFLSTKLHLIAPFPLNWHFFEMAVTN